MPELPEVESICQGLRSNILNCSILSAKALTNLKLRQIIPEELPEKIINSKIIKIDRRAKYIQVFLDNDIIIIIHLGMSGKVLIKPDNYIFQKHDHFMIGLDNNLKIIYNDPRRFGLITYTYKNNINNFSLFRSLAPEPLEAEFTVNYLQNILKKSSKPIKLLLMDNAKVVGVGNIYAAESLFLSKISPIRESNTLTPDEIKLLHANIIEILQQSIKAGGSTLKDYALINGEKGFFQNSFKVYGKEGKECMTCKNIIIKIKQAGRASFYCVQCQK